MLWEFFKNASTRIKAAAKSVKTKFLVLIGQPEPEAPEKCPVQKNRYTSKARTCDEQGPVVQTDEQPRPDLFALHLLW